jgi:prevent-host-death family protein
MIKTVSATEAKAKLSDLMKSAVKSGDSVIIQSRGYPQVVIVPYTEYEELQRLKERARRAEAIMRLQEIARDTQMRNEDMTPDDAEALAEEISREAIENLVRKGVVRFERPVQ